MWQKSGSGVLSLYMSESSFNLQVVLLSTLEMFILHICEALNPLSLQKEQLLIASVGKVSLMSRVQLTGRVFLCLWYLLGLLLLLQALLQMGVIFNT